MAIILPHVFQDGSVETASGVQVNENFNTLKAAIEAIETADATFALLSQLPTGAKIRTGTGTGTWASQQLNVVINHGLGKAPTFASMSLVAGGTTFTAIHFVGVASQDATKITFLSAPDTGVTISDGATTNYQWVAIG